MSTERQQNTRYAKRTSRRNLKLSSLLLFALLLIAVTACGGAAGDEPTPPAIHYGEDICEFCGMIISEERYAAAYVTRDGQGRIFDDVGDMVQAHLQRQEDVAAFFVHDHETRDWIRAETAYFVLSPDLPTPMLSGLAACAAPEQAADLAAELGGEVFTFDELVTYLRDKPDAHGRGPAAMGGAPLMVMEPWARPAPQAGNSAVYLTLMNQGDAADALLRVESDVAAAVELHETKMEGDVMKMSPLASIGIPAGGSASLQPGGMHVMLVNVKRELAPGDTITLTLNFENAGPMTVEAQVRAADATMGDEVPHDMDHSMDAGEDTQ